jgi:DNA-binding transcriptional ArsR family regulator
VVLRVAGDSFILNHMVQYESTRESERSARSHSAQLDRSFAAVADATRRGILERLGRGEASITDLAAQFRMTLTGMKKHVGILEGAGLVKTRKFGRVRQCAVGPRRLDEELRWIADYRRAMEARLDRLADFLARDGSVE